MLMSWASCLPAVRFHSYLIERLQSVKNVLLEVQLDCLDVNRTPQHFVWGRGVDNSNAGKLFESIGVDDCRKHNCFVRRRRETWRDLRLIALSCSRPNN